MSLSAAVLDALVASGATQEMLVAAMKADIIVRGAEAAAKLEAKRQSNRERQNRKRERDRHAESRVTAVTARDERDVGSNERDNLTSHESKKSEPKGSSKKFILPSDIPAEPWGGWEDMRRKIRKVPTDHARSLAVAELRRLRDEEGWPPGEVLNHCTMNSYQGIFPPNRNRQNERSDRDPTTVAVERYLRGDVGTHAGTG